MADQEVAGNHAPPHDKPDDVNEPDVVNDAIARIAKEDHNQESFSSDDNNSLSDPNNSTEDQDDLKAIRAAATWLAARGHCHVTAILIPVNFLLKIVPNSYAEILDGDLGLIRYIPHIVVT